MPTSDASGSGNSAQKRPRRSPLVSKAKSCFECRKNKLRCSRTWPCNNCVRRGVQDQCSGIGPTDKPLSRPAAERSLSRQSQSPAQRPNLADSPGPSHAIHTLAAVAAASGYDDYEHNDASSSSPSSLSLRPVLIHQRNGRTQYFGHAAHSSYLAAGHGQEGAAAAMLRDSDDENELVHLRLQLPPAEHMRGVLTAFQERIAWQYDVGGQWSAESLLEGGENVALAYAILAIVEGSKTHYKRCWRALDALQWTATNSLVIQQTFFVLCLFLLNFAGGQLADRFTTAFGVCVAKAIESGLHTDAKHSDAAKRRQLFWQLYCLDAFRSLAYGRPCFFQPATVTLGQPAEHSYDFIKYSTAQIIGAVISSGPKSFDDTVHFDVKLRKLFERVPPELRVQKFGQEQSRRHVLQSCSIALNIHQTLLYLYRPWFVSAALQSRQHEAADTDAQHRRAVFCVAESASKMVEFCCRAFRTDAEGTLQWAFFMHHAFNAGVCRAIQAIYGRDTDPLYYDAKEDVDAAIALLAKTQEHASGPIWTVKLSVLRRLRRSAEKGGRSGHDSRRGSNLGLLGAADLRSRAPTDDVAAQASVDGGSALVDDDDIVLADDWLDLLNTDDFTATMADLWSSSHNPFVGHAVDVEVVAQSGLLP